MNKTKINRIIQANFDMERLNDILQSIDSAGLVFDTEKTIAPTYFVEHVREFRYIHHNSTHSMVISRELADAIRKMANISNWLAAVLDGSENIDVKTTECRYLSFGRKSEIDKETLIKFVKATGCTFANLCSCDSWSPPHWQSSKPKEWETFGTLWEKKIGGLWSWPEGYDIGTFGQFLG